MASAAARAHAHVKLNLGPGAEYFTAFDLASGALHRDSTLNAATFFSAAGSQAPRPSHLRKLGLETRTAAALCAIDLLGRIEI